MSSLFGHLALQFGSSPENLATEALHYIITQSAVARRAFVSLLESFGQTFPEPLHFQTQSADEKGAIPDLVGKDVTGREHAIIEAKFWAGLTPRQPLAYFDRLPSDDGLLLFIAPARRTELLWYELLQRCHRAELAINREEKPNAERRLAHFQSGRRLGFVSWRNVLETINNSVTEAGEAQVLADILQLRGLTERMDSDLFLPLTGEELTSNLGTRVLQLCQIVDRTVERMAKAGLADTKDCRASGGRHGVYSQYFRLSCAGCRVYFSPENWSKDGCPLLIEFRGLDWKPSLEVNAKLAPLANRFNGRYWVGNGGTWLGLEILIGVELDALVDHLIAQICEAKAILDASMQIS
jgi:hypothetical protein